MPDESHGAPTPYAPPAPGAVTVYRGAIVFDGTDRPPRRAAIVVDGERIRHVVDETELPPCSRTAPRPSTSTAATSPPV
ncbi:hypothetical protein ACFQ1I_44810 [Kitasatospora arboriphila]